MDPTDENHVEGMTRDRKQTNDNDFSTALSERTHQSLTVSERPSGSHSEVQVTARPTLKWTKSFPPYSQCIGGLGDLGDDHLSHDEVVKEDRDAVLKGVERKEDVAVTPRCVRDEIRAKWRARRKERLGGSFEADTDRWRGGRWRGKRRVETDNKGDHSEKEREGGEWKLWRSRNTSFESEIEKEGDEERRRSPVSLGEGEKVQSRQTSGEKDEERAKELSQTGSQWSCSPHPILSKLLHSSSSASSCSSVNLSSAESDEVFSETEDVGTTQKTFRKCRSWKTYLTIMHWSLRRQSSWVQLAGHQGHFRLSEGGEVLKLYSEDEARCLDCLMGDPLRPFVPQYHGTVTKGEDCYICLEDLLSGLRRPVIMDCKMGVRTYKEEELAKATLRGDMYQKMAKTDPSALSSEEHAQNGVTKWRYLQWRDRTTSTATLGFRIEGIMMEDGSIQRDFRKILTSAQVTEALLYFTGGQLDILKAYHSRLLALSEALMNSPFFRTHEVIGSSLLFAHDHSSKASVWMIDFGKTSPVHETVKLLHNIPWVEGNREDGYLIGLSSLITSLSQAICAASFQQEKSVT